MAAPNPLSDIHTAPPPPLVSLKTLSIGGILTSVYGLEELPRDAKSISCLWLLHPRLQKAQIMHPVASMHINDWQKRQSSDNQKGLIAVAFDQRNHGSREVSPLANQAWREGNETHAQDMFSIFHGTAVDTSLLIDHLESYIFHQNDSRKIDQHFVMGISLGGHSAWQIILNDARVTAAIIVIGCPDYMSMMSDRARLSKLRSYTKSNGADFLGSKDFPKALVSSVQRWDPKGLLFGTSAVEVNPSESDQKRLRDILDTRIKGKRILICSGGADKLVPNRCSESFIQFLKNATSGWYKDGNVYVEDNVYPGVGHVYSEGMAKDTTRFVSDILSDKPSKPVSKM